VAVGRERATYGLKATAVVLELHAVMLGRIVKFRRGDQYEEMEGRDEAGKSTTSNANSAGQTNRQADTAGDSTVAARDTTPDGTLAGFQLV